MTGFPVFSLQVNESWSCHWKKTKTKKKKAVIQPLHPAARIWPQFQLLQNILLIIAFYISFPLILIHSQTETRSCKLRTVRNNKRPSASGGAGRKNWIFNYFIFLWRQSFIWRPQYGVDKKKKKKGRISVHSWPDQRQRISSSICCAVCVSSHRHSFFDCGFKMPFLGGNRAEWGGGAQCAEGSCRNSAHMRIRDSFCNSLPLSRQRMYLSNHLNYYNHCWNGNARISSLTLRDFRGPESTHRWVSVSLQNRITLCEMSLPKKKREKKNSWNQIKTSAVILQGCKKNKQKKTVSASFGFAFHCRFLHVNVLQMCRLGLAVIYVVCVDALGGLAFWLRFNFHAKQRLPW